MDSWDEIRTAFHVARLRTVSGAAEVLGVHHATVIRHIDALEAKLGIKLFQRHARGYTPTEAGEDLLRVAQATDDQFGQLVGRIKGRGSEVSGELVITALPDMTHFLMPVLRSFQEAHPEVCIRLLTGERLFRLEYGEAHVALRAGPPPEQPDNVVQALVTQDSALFAHKDYVARHGAPAGPEDFADHRFIGPDSEANRAPFYVWLREHIDRRALTFRSTDAAALREALLGGVGLGFLPVIEGRAEPDLVEVLGPRPEWSASLWLVTHVDLHRTAKVQAFVGHIKAAAKNWAAQEAGGKA